MHDAVASQTAAIASGDAEAFAAFYRAWFDFALQEAWRCTRRDEQFCLDVVQDAMLRVIRSMRPLNSVEDVERWLRRVVQSCAFDHLRQEGRRTRRERQHGALPVDAADDETTERLIWLRQQLRALEPQQMRLVWLRYHLNWTLERIGALVGLSPGAVDGRLTRTIAALRRSGTKEFPND